MGERPVRCVKYLLNWEGVPKPRWSEIWAAVSSPCASRRFASSTTRRSMNSFAPSPAPASVARARVRPE